jgi:peptidoglycan/xylan/chitin deacetylase (PgdA/CDA1 family)
MRLDRSITLGLVHPVRRMLFSVQGSRFKVQGSGPFPVPILMYHSISDEHEPGVPAYYQTNTSPAVFRQHMQFLADQGYKAVSLDQLVSMLTIGLQDYRTTGPQDHGGTMSRNPIPAFSFQLSAFPKLVCITFDDGFRSFYTEAFPALQEHGFTATMFLSTAFIGDTRRYFRPSTINSQPSTTQECLTWSEIRELRQAGIHFGSHTVNHPKLLELDWPEIESEISDSKANIEQRLGEPVTTFCYPFAFPQTNRPFVEGFTASLREAGYRCCATTKLGRSRVGDDPYSLKRLPANSLDDAAFFAAKLEGAYDWLAAPQSAVKALKALLRPHSSGKKPVPLASAPSNPSRSVRSAEQ